MDFTTEPKVTGITIHREWPNGDKQDDTLSWPPIELTRDMRGAFGELADAVNKACELQMIKKAWGIDV